ncbi:uncharacterized protein LOC121382133 [Gigantopelta aegis]|uniref:uncharacterized protein LOC121382133 n=1 Tax=Gigantopelta aegis TaxID=1735272 RepID=UPI001B88876C|nr:uncharacterized protein LOC121382133 [Gigantopelta aegis]
MARISSYFCKELEWACDKCERCGRLCKKGENSKFVPHLCTSRTCSWNPRDTMLQDVDINPLTGQVADHSVRCPAHICPYRHYSWHVAEITTPAIGTEPPAPDIRTCVCQPKSDKPINLSIHHDSIFDDVATTRAPNYLVHPDWLSEKVNPPKICPLKRPPWPWEQPRHRMNLQEPITYVLPEDEKRKDKEKCMPYHRPCIYPQETCHNLKNQYQMHY